MLKLKLLPIKTHSLIFLTLFFLVAGYVYFIAEQVISEPMNLWSDAIPQADCAVVLTGAPGRVREGFEVLAQHKVKKLIVSGVYKDVQLHEIFPYLPFYPEVNTEDIILEKRSETTIGNASQSLTVSEALRCRDILLMTSQIHMSRAYFIFKVHFPDSVEIKKLSLPNSKLEKSIATAAIEIFKTALYYGLSLGGVIKI